MAETQIPIAAGKAAAMSAYLARGGERVAKGGTRRPGFRYTSGPMKGKTAEQATAEFENKWAGAPGAVKDKYARRESAKGALSPTEYAKYGPEYDAALKSGAMRGKQIQANSMQLGNQGGDPNETDFNDMVGKSSGTFKKNGQGGVPSAPSAPATTPATTAVDPAAKTVNPNATAGAGRGKDITPQQKNAEADFKALTQVPDGGVQPVGNANPDGTSKGKSQAEFEKKPFDSSKGLAGQFLAGIEESRKSAAGAPPATGLPKAPTLNPNATAGAGRGTPLKKEDYRPIGSRAEDVAAANGDASKLPTDSRMATKAPAAPKIEMTGPPSPPPLVGPPAPLATANRPEAPTGAAVLTRPQRDEARAQTGGSVNRLTGLPGGFLPGDALPAGADVAMRNRANESQARQTAASATAAPPRAIPVIQPTPAPRPTDLSQSGINRPRTVTTGVEARAADEMRRQAGINANPATINPDDPKKFFTGRTLPLDQLNAGKGTGAPTIPGLQPARKPLLSRRA